MLLKKWGNGPEKPVNYWGNAPEKSHRPGLFDLA
jgi:hypothetical protein